MGVLSITSNPLTVTTFLLTFTISTDVILIGLGLSLFVVPIL